MASCINPSTKLHGQAVHRAMNLAMGPFWAARHPSRKSDPCRWHLASQVPAAGTNGGYIRGTQAGGPHPCEIWKPKQKKHRLRIAIKVLLQSFYSGGWTITQNPRLVLDRIRSVHFGAPNWVLHCLPLLCLVPSCAPMAMNIIYMVGGFNPSEKY